LKIEITTNFLNDIFGLSNRIEIPKRDSIVLRDLFDLWTEEHGKKVMARLYDSSGLREEVILLVNDRNVGFLSGLDTEILDGDRIVILSAVTGG
jgi:sulfur carrier protein ThiS